MEEDDFGPDLYATVPEVMAVQVSNPAHDAPSLSKDDEDRKIKALVETPALDWQGFDCTRGGNCRWGGRSFGRGGRMMGGRVCGRGLTESKVPPQGYVCRRCNIPGHFIQHCPTNGNPDYDIVKTKAPTGIPKSMLVSNPEGSYVLDNGDYAVLKPNEAAFDKEMEGMLSTQVAVDLPPELHCPICKETMKYAVLTSRCCLRSFCDKCIRDYIISKLICICGAVGALADDLIPNKTLRETIARLLESGNSSSAGSSHGSSTVVQGSQTRRSPSSHSAAPRGANTEPLRANDVATSKDVVNDGKSFGMPEKPNAPKENTVKVSDVPKATLESAHVEKPASPQNPLLNEEQRQPKVSTSDERKEEEKKRKKSRLPSNDLAFGSPSATAYPQWSTPEFAAEDYMTPMDPSAYNPYWGGIQMGMSPYMTPFGCPMPYNMAYDVSLMDTTPFWGVLLPDACGTQASCILRFLFIAAIRTRIMMLVEK